MKAWKRAGRVPDIVLDGVYMHKTTRVGYLELANYERFQSGRLGFPAVRWDIFVISTPGSVVVTQRDRLVGLESGRIEGIRTSYHHNSVPPNLVPQNSAAGRADPNCKS